MLIIWQHENKRVSVLRRSLITLTSDDVAKKYLNACSEKKITCGKLLSLSHKFRWSGLLHLWKSSFVISTFGFGFRFSGRSLVLVLRCHLAASVSFAATVQQLHPVPFNKIHPNRKHSEEINSGLQCCGHPFGLTVAAKTQRLQLFYTAKAARWVNQDLWAFSIHHNKVRVELTDRAAESLCGDPLSECRFARPLLIQLFCLC